MPRELTEKQTLFVQEYLVDLNATKAALRAGYSDNSPSEIGSELLRKTSVKAAIRKELKKRARRLQISADKVLREYAIIGFSDIGHILDFTGDEIRLKPAKEIDLYARRAIKSFKVKTTSKGSGDDKETINESEFQLWDKLSALDKISKHIGLYDGEITLDAILMLFPERIREAARKAIEAEIRHQEGEPVEGTDDPEGEGEPTA